MPLYVPQRSPAIKAYADLTGFDGGVAFTVTGGVVSFKPVGLVGAHITSTSGTTVLGLGTTATPAIALTAEVDGANLAAGGVWVSGSFGATDIAGDTGATFFTAEDLVLAPDVDDLTAGSLTLYVIWEPVSPGATLVAA